MDEKKSGYHWECKYCDSPEQCRIQMNRTFLCVQDAELNGKIAKYKYQMKKTKVFGGNKLN